MSSDGDEDAAVPYSQRPEWRDVTPIPQDDGPQPAAPIAYTDEFRETMEYFRAILQMDERSERTLALTADVIDLNSSNYTVWYFRRLILREPHMNTDWLRELAFCSTLAPANLKNYQLWHHRRLCVEEGRPDPDAEIAFLASILDLDDKNYHAWKHRQFVVELYGRHEQELAYTESMLENDLRNNSAWNHRMFAVRALHRGAPVPRDVVEREVDFAVRAIRRAPNNESPWLYAAGFFVPDRMGDAPAHRYADVPALRAACDEILTTYADAPLMTHHALACLVDVLASEGTPAAHAAARQHCETLAVSDPVRERYWRHVAGTLTAE